MRIVDRQNFRCILTSLFFCLLIHGAAKAGDPLRACEVAFDYKEYDGPLPQVGGITFSNLSTGDYNMVSWDFGDGDISSSTDSLIDHFYLESGVYKVCLTIFNGTDCSQDTCQEVLVDLRDGSCNQDDCVYPGDINLDGVVDMYDLIPLGYGYGENGPPRPNATLDFVPQPAVDWEQETPDGINYKHLDCDGNGNISVMDVQAIVLNNQAIRDPITNYETSDPEVYVRFDQDTIYITDQSPDMIEFSARVFVGTEDMPIEDVQGLAIALDYDTSLVTPVNGVRFTYDQSSFLGDITEVASFGIDQRNDQQIDMGFTKVNKQAASGFGMVAKLDYIVESDIIGGRSTQGRATFELPVTGFRAKDSEGKIIQLTTGKKPAQLVFIIDKTTTSTQDPELEAAVQLLPNPASAYLRLDAKPGLRIESWTLSNSIGQTVIHQPSPINQQPIPVDHLQRGIYFATIQTDRGSVFKKIILK